MVAAISPYNRSNPQSPHEILRFQAGHRLAVFHCGREAIGAMLDAIEHAQQSIHLETNFLRADATGRRLLSRLEARAHDGVSIRMILDAVGSRGLDRRALNRVIDGGGEFVEFNPLSVSCRRSSSKIGFEIASAKWCRAYCDMASESSKIQNG